VREIAVLLTIQTDDARLEGYDKITTVAGIAALRHAVVDAVPEKTTRLIAVIDVFRAQAMMTAMAAADTALGLPPVYAPKNHEPPPDWVC
jgi:hypothetical protein